MKFTHFALIQTGYCVLGVGETVEEARADAAQWLDDPSSASSVPEFKTMGALRSRTVNGGLALVPCTVAFYNYVNENGTTTWGESNDGICLTSETEAQ